MSSIAADGRNALPSIAAQRLRFHYLSVFGGDRVSLLALSDRVRGLVAKTRVGGRGSAKRGAIMEVFC